MPNARETATNKSIRAKADREYKQCRDQTLNRLKASPAQIIELDTLGFPIQTVSRALVVKNRGFTYFFNHSHNQHWYFFDDNPESWLVLSQIPNENRTE